MKQFRNSPYYVKENGEIVNTITNKILKHSIRKNKKNTYKRVFVSIKLDNIRYLMQLHRVLAECFIPNPNNLPQINHIDGNPLNNNLSNLEWISARDNNLHAINTGLRPTKLNKKIADEIRLEYSQGVTQKDLGIKYNTRQTNISKIVNNISWQ